MLRRTLIATTLLPLAPLLGCFAVPAPDADDSNEPVDHRAQALDRDLPGRADVDFDDLRRFTRYYGAQTGLDLPGGDIRSTATTGAEDCRAKCAAEEECKAFTYVAPGIQGAGARCWLKSRITADAVAVSGIASGVVRENGVEYGVQRRGSDYRSFATASADPEVCREACAKESQACKAFTLVAAATRGADARCVLKNRVSPPTFASGAYSGVGPFSPPSGTVWADTFQNLWLSEVAYWDGSYPRSPEGADASKSLCMSKLGLSLVHYSEGASDAEVLVARRGNEEVLVGLAGSESASDWIVDLASARMAFEGVRVHAGFLQRAKAAYPRIKQHVGDYLRGANAARRIVLTGHSLGGAMAQLAAVMLKVDFPDIDVRVMTFGSPRVGADDWVAKYNGIPGLRSATIHWVNQEDFVTSYPFDDDRWQVTGRIFRLDELTHDGCDLRGFSTWGEYFDMYGEDPICHPYREFKATFDARYRNQRVRDGRIADHSLLDGYRATLGRAKPAREPALSTLVCRSDDSSGARPAPIPRVCPPRQHCTVETASLPTCTCIPITDDDP